MDRTESGSGGGGSSVIPSVLPFTQWTQLNCALCIAASVCALVFGIVLFNQYFCTSYSHVLRSTFNDVFLAAVMVQVLQALQLLIFSVITLFEGHSSNHHGMTFAMCNVSASLYQFLDSALQVLQIAFFVVLGNSRRLTSLEVVDENEDRVNNRCYEEDYPYSSGRSSLCHANRRASADTSQISFSNDVPHTRSLFGFLTYSHAPPRAFGLRHTLLRITWKVYFSAFLYASVLLIVCWLVLAFVPGLSIESDGASDKLTGTLYFSHEFAWCWIPGTADIAHPLSKVQTATLILLQLIAAYITPFVFIGSAVFAYRSLRRSSPSLLRDHPIVHWRIVVFCVYPIFVCLLSAAHRFLIVENAYVSAFRNGLAVAVSFLYPFSAVVNVVLFLHTENLLRQCLLPFRRCRCCRRCCAAASPADNKLDCGSNTSRSGGSSERGDDGVAATTGFCGVVKAIACSTVAGMPQLFQPLFQDER